MDKCQKCGKKGLYRPCTAPGAHRTLNLTITYGCVPLAMCRYCRHVIKPPKMRQNYQQPKN